MNKAITVIERLLHAAGPISGGVDSCRDRHFIVPVHCALYIAITCSLFLVSCSGTSLQKPETEADGCRITVASYNLWTSDSRKKYLTSDKSIDRQRFWRPSSVAMLEAIKDVDCDILAFQEICDSIYGRKGAAVSLKVMMEKAVPDYSWVVWSNVDSKKVEDGGRISYTPGICYKTSVLDLTRSGIFWLGGNPDAPQWGDGFSPEYGDPKRACVWALFRHKESGKQFYFLSAHLDTRSFNGIPYPYVNTENCRNLMEYADAELIPKGVPSIIAGDMNVSDKEDGYIDYLNRNTFRVHHWINAYEAARSMSALGTCAKAGPGTTNTHSETDGKDRIDHIFYDGFTIKEYEVVRRKYATRNGTLHYPSDHFPVTATLLFKQ